MTNIDLSRFFNVNGRNVSSGLSSGLDTEHLINAMLKPKIEVVEKIEEKNNFLSTTAEAFTSLQGKMLNVKKSVDLSSGMKGAIKQRSIMINGLPYNEYIGISADNSVDMVNFSLSNVKLAQSKSMISPKFDGAGANIVNTLGIKPGPLRFSNLTKLQTKITGVKSNATAGNSVLNGDIENLLSSISQFGSYQDFAGKMSENLKSVVVHKPTNDQVKISLYIKDQIYTSDPVILHEGKILPSSKLTFYNHNNSMRFNLFTNNSVIDLNTDDDVLQFIENTKKDLGTLDINVLKSPLSVNQSSFFSNLTSDDIIFVSDEIGKEVVCGPFSITADSNGSKLAIQVNGERYVANLSSNIISGTIQLYNSNADKHINITLSDSDKYDISQSGAMIFERALNQMLGIKTGMEIYVEADDNLLTLEGKINAKASSLGVKAKMLGLGIRDFRLIIESNEAGIDNDFVVSDDFGKLFITRDARDASFNFNGIEVQKSTNVINDLVPNVTINLLKNSTNDMSFNVNIRPDIDNIEKAINNFVESYNDLQYFIASQKEADANGKFVETAVLKSNYVLSQISNRLSDDVSGVYGNSTSMKKLVDIGIYVDRVDTSRLKYNVVRFDKNRFNIALSKDHNAVLSILDAFSDKISDTIYSETNRESALKRSMDIINQEMTQNVAHFNEVQGQVDYHKERLLERYSELERKVIKANSMMDLMKAQQDAFNSSK